MTERPINALSEITITDTKLFQVINFYYYDPDEIYKKIKENLINDDHDSEFEIITENMQAYLDEDEVFINSNEIFLDIVNGYISYPHQQSFFNPLLTFEISSTPYSLKDGKNIIELIGDVQITPYPINIKWNLPGRVLKVTSETFMKITGNIIFFTSNKNDSIGGYELIEFIYPM
ncbi:MAG: hypothetical protein ACW981_01985 [Candidatus Hodarchaeales archaeon]